MSNMNASTKIAKLAVLISGNGSNLQAIIDACTSKELPAEIAVVVANKKTALGLERAKRADIPTIIKMKDKMQERHVYDAELADHIAHFQPDWIILAGWMHILSHDFLNRFPNRVINLHPALPEQFPGIHAIERAFVAYQEKKIQHTGIMVHLVSDEQVDCGPVLATTDVPIFDDDTLASLTERMHETEHQLLISTLKNLFISHERSLHAESTTVST